MNDSIWTVLDVPSQMGKTILVTGANVGLGYESVRALARKEAHVIMACRNLEKGELAREAILAESPNAKLDLRYCDLADFSSVEKFSQGIIADYPKLDVLLNNAGLNFFRRHENKDGFELTFATNHLGHFALTRHLFPLLKKTANSRIVHVSSGAHLSGTINFNDLMLNKSYSFMKSYGQSKLANILFAKEIQRRVDAGNISMLSAAVHPGLNRTNMLYRFTGTSRISRWMVDLFAGRAHPPKVGARVQLYTSTERDVQGGGYYVPDLNGRPKIGFSTKEANDPEVANRLWKKSEELLGMKFDI